MWAGGVRLVYEVWCVDRQHVGLQIRNWHTLFTLTHTHTHARSHTRAHARTRRLTRMHLHTHTHTHKHTFTSDFHQSTYLPCHLIFLLFLLWCTNKDTKNTSYKTLFSAFSTFHHQMFGCHGYPCREPCLLCTEEHFTLSHLRVFLLWLIVMSTANETQAIQKCQQLNAVYDTTQPCACFSWISPELNKRTVCDEVLAWTQNTAKG